MKVFEIDGSTLTSALFADVANSKELLDLMQAGTLEPEVAFLNASLIPDVFPVLAAAHKTLLAKSRESLTTRTLHSELVYNYSGSKHITESFKRCGISESSTYVLVARFGSYVDEMISIEKLVKGKEIDLEELLGRANQAQIQKHYKIPGLELEISSLQDAITCRMLPAMPCDVEKFSYLFRDSAHLYHLYACLGTMFFWHTNLEALMKVVMRQWIQ